MKRFLFAFFCIVNALLFCACNTVGDVIVENEYYAIHERDGKRYITMSGVLPERQRNGNAMSAVPYVSFCSLSEMKSDIDTGNFSLDEILILQELCGVNIQRETINHHSLLEPILPAGWELTNIEWGSTTTYDFDSENGQGQKINGAFFTEYQYTDRLNHELSSTESNQKYYKFETEGKIFYVFEKYYTKTSPNIPDYVDILLSEHGSYLLIHLNNFGERPSMEWLSQFGIREYVETETE